MPLIHQRSVTQPVSYSANGRSTKKPKISRDTLGSGLNDLWPHKLICILNII